MLLKRQLMRLLVIGGLAVMTSGIASAGGGWWSGGPAPKAAQTMTTQPSMFSAIWTLLVAMF